jgi:group I intron endonuclease
MKGIYAIRHIESGRCYVGSSVNFSRRWIEHRRKIKAGTHPARHMLHAFQKYGADAFAFVILEECDVSSEATRIERENHWMSVLKPVFNVAPVAGSVLGLKRSDEAKANMSKAQKGRVSNLRGIPRTQSVKDAIGAAHKGRSKTDEHRANLSASLMGRIGPRKGVTLSEETKAKISRNRSGIARSAEASAAAALANKGRKRTEEQRLKMSRAQKGRTFSEDTKLKMSFAALAYQARRREQHAG